METGWLFFVFTECGDGFIAHRWSWRHVGRDGVSASAAQGFTTLVACQADASEHGFTPGDEVTIDSQGARRYGRLGGDHQAGRPT